MSIAIHCGLATKMDYSHRDLPHDEWVNSKAWRILKSEPKWMLQPSPSAALSRAITLDSGCLAPPSAGGSDEDRAEEYLEADSPGSSGGMAERRPGGGSAPTSENSAEHASGAAINASATRPSGKYRYRSKDGDEKQSRADMSIAHSLRESVAMKRERIAMMAFDGSDLDEEDLAMKREFFKLKRKKAMMNAREEMLSYAMETQME
jgi:hypothetical protein